MHVGILRLHVAPLFYGSCCRTLSTVGTYTSLMMWQDEGPARRCVDDDAMSPAAAARRPSSVSSTSVVVVVVGTADQLVSVSVARSQHVVVVAVVVDVVVAARS